MKQAYATRTPIRTVIYLPDNYDNIVMSISITITGTIATLGKPVISKPDVEDIRDMIINKSFTYDNTWDPRLLPLTGTEIIDGNQFIFMSNITTEHDITIDIIPAPRQYLVGIIKTSVVPVYPKVQNMSGLRYGDIRPIS